MADRLSDLIVERAVRADRRVLAATIATSPASMADDLYVTVDAFDGSRQRWGPCKWSPASALPERGDACLLLLDEDEAPWVITDEPVLADVTATASATTLTPGSAATVAVTEPTENAFAFAFGIPAGSKWWTGSGAPAGALGVVGDVYLNTATGDVYQKTAAAAWTLTGNIRGPAGPQGPAGAQGATGAQGPTGATGSQGAQGPQGPAGTPDTLGAWQGLGLQSGWGNFGSPYSTAQARRSSQGIVWLRGVVTAPSGGGSGTIITTLPGGWAPKAQLGIITLGLGTTLAMRLDIHTDGGIYCTTGPNAGVGLSLDNIAFPTDS
jgi:hypothetical protein